MTVEGLEEQSGQIEGAELIIGVGVDVVAAVSEGASIRWRTSSSKMESLLGAAAVATSSG
jgi:hypothetical protein